MNGMVTTSWAERHVSSATQLQEATGLLQRGIMRLVVYLRGMRKDIWDNTSIEIRCGTNHVLAVYDQSWHVLVLRRQLQNSTLQFT